MKDDTINIYTCKKRGNNLKQEYKEKLENYKSEEYEMFLRKKCVLDARQFLKYNYIEDERENIYS